MNELLIPMAAIDRTIKMPFDLARWENDAEHSYFLATLGCALGRELDPELDLGLVSQYALVHDLVEVYAGDTPVWAPAAELAAKPAREAWALARIRRRFGGLFPWVSDTIAAYERLDEAESCFVYALDKILPHAIITLARHQPVTSAPAARKDQLRVAQLKIARYPRLLPLFEAMSSWSEATAGSDTTRTGRQPVPSPASWRPLRSPVPVPVRQ